MSPKLQAAVRNVALALHIPAAMALLSIPVALLAEEWFAVAAFALTGVLAAVIGQTAYWLCNVDDVLGTKRAMATVVVSWGLISLVGAIPLYVIGLDADAARSFPAARVFADPWSALFEAFSGFTVTGLTMADKVSGLPLSVLWWRSLMQWIGGIGIMALMLSVLHPSRDAYRFYVSEGREQTITRDLVHGVRTMWWIYLAYTAFAVALLRIAGMTWWQALNHAMTGIATAGFSVTDGSLGDFGTPVKLAMMVVIALGAISFAVHARILTHGRASLLWRDTETRCLLILFVVGAGVLMLENLWYGGDPLVVDSAFQWVSALGTAGFSTVDVSAWSPTAHLLLAVGMAVGGAAGSTAGGLKIHRVLRIAEAAYFRIKSVAAHPWRVVEHRQISDEEERRKMVRALEAAMTMLAIWAITLFLGTLLLLHAAGPDAALSHVLFDVASALGNVGISTGVTGADLPWYGKAGLMLIMWISRLEAIPILVVLGLALRPFVKSVEAVEEGTRRETTKARGKRSAHKTTTNKNAGNGRKKPSAKTAGSKKAGGGKSSSTRSRAGKSGSAKDSGAQKKSGSGGRNSGGGS